jgi:hypothetical protein
MADDEQDDAAVRARRDNALRFIRHPSAFVYSEDDYTLLRALAHDGLTEPPEGRGLETSEQ